MCVCAYVSVLGHCILYDVYSLYVSTSDFEHRSKCAHYMLISTDREVEESERVCVCMYRVCSLVYML